MVALVYMAAGISSRCNGKIKALVPVLNEKTLIDASLEQALKSGFDKIIFIVSRKTEQAFKEKFKDKINGIPVFYALQEYDETRDKPWGTVDAVVSASKLLDSSFVVCNTDDLYGEETFKLLYQAAAKKENAVIGFKLINTLPREGEVNRALFKAQDNLVKSLKEGYGWSMENLSTRGIDKNSLCSMNIFAFNLEVLDLLEKDLTDFKLNNKDDRKIELILCTEINKLISENKIQVKLYPSEDKVMGITNPGDEVLVREALIRSL